MIMNAFLLYFLSLNILSVAVMIIVLIFFSQQLKSDDVDGETRLEELQRADWVSSNDLKAVRYIAEHVLIVQKLHCSI